MNKKEPTQTDILEAIAATIKNLAHDIQASPNEQTNLTRAETIRRLAEAYRSVAG